MFLTPSVLIQAGILALGIWWCLEMLPRWRHDWRELRDANDWSTRAVVMVLWGITVLIALMCLGSILTIGRNIVHGIRSLV